MSDTQDSSKITWAPFREVDRAITEQLAQEAVYTHPVNCEICGQFMALKCL